MTVEQRARRVVAQVFGLKEANVSADASQETLEKWDSLGHMNLCVALEDEFRVRFDDTQVVEMKSVPKIVEIVSPMLRG